VRGSWFLSMAERISPLVLIALGMGLLMASMSDAGVLEQLQKALPAKVMDRTKAGRAQILLIRYLDEEKAKEACSSFLKHYLPEADPSGLARLENQRWCGALAKGSLVAVVLEADSWDLAAHLVGDLVRVSNILVMLTPQFHGVGPHSFSKEYIWSYCGLIVGTDPVSADATGAIILQKKRDAFFGTRKPISPPLNHIMAADTRFGLGNSRPERIEVVRLGWEEGVLI
jgi:hypothetical protein